MKIIENPKIEEALIRKIIEKHGHTPDHNFDWLMYCADEGKPKAAIFEDKYLIWSFASEKGWIICSDPIAPAKIRLKILQELINYLIGRNADKIFFLDVREEINNFCKKKYQNNYFFEYELIWPVLNMGNFNPSLPGGHFKSIRNAKNKFYKENEVKVVLALSVEKNELHKTV